MLVIAVAVATGLACHIQSEFVVTGLQSCDCLMHIHRVGAVVLAHIPALLLNESIPCTEGTFPSLGAGAQVWVDQYAGHIHARLIASGNGLIEHLIHARDFLIYKRVGCQMLLCDVEVATQGPILAGLSVAGEVVLQGCAVGTNEIVVLVKVCVSLVALLHISLIHLDAGSHSIAHVQHLGIGRQEVGLCFGAGESLRQSAAVVYQPLLGHCLVEVLVCGSLHVAHCIQHLNVLMNQTDVLASLHDNGVCGVEHGIVLVAHILEPCQLVVVVTHELDAEATVVHLLVSDDSTLCAVERIHVIRFDTNYGIKQIALIGTCMVAFAYCVVVLYGGMCTQPTRQQAVFCVSMHTAGGVAVAYADGTTVVSTWYAAND